MCMTSGKRQRVKTSRGGSTPAGESGRRGSPGCGPVSEAPPLVTAGLPARRWPHYRDLIDDDLADEVEQLADALRGTRVVHVSSAASRSCACEQVPAEVALLRDLDLRAEWRISCPEAEVAATMRAVDALLEGRTGTIAPGALAALLEHLRSCGRALADSGADVVIVHDPQLAFLIASAPSESAAWIWHCHLDISTPEAAFWDLLRPFVWGYDEVVFDVAAFAPPGIRGDRVRELAPAIDPFATRNRPLPPAAATRIVAGLGIDVARPLVVHAAGFDPWLDPFGAVQAWRRARELVPGLQLAVTGEISPDEPRERQMFDAVAHAAAAEDDCHVLESGYGEGDIQVNALRTVAAVAVHRPARESFGLAVSEALWKRLPVIASARGGIPLQLRQGAAGILADDLETCGAAIAALLADPPQANRLARAGHEHVRTSFLTPRAVRDALRLYHDALSSPTATASVIPLAKHHSRSTSLLGAVPPLAG